MHITKGQLRRIIKEETKIVLEGYKAGDWSFQSPERKKELEDKKRQVEDQANKIESRMNAMDDSLAYGTRLPTDEEERTYKKLNDQLTALRAKLRALTPAPEPEEEDDFSYGQALMDKLAPDFSDVRSPRDRKLMIAIKKLVPQRVQAAGNDAVVDFIGQREDGGELGDLIHDLAQGTNWGEADLTDEKMWQSIPKGE